MMASSMLIVNLEEGMPTAEQAERRLIGERRASSASCKVNPWLWPGGCEIEKVSVRAVFGNAP